MTSSQDGWRLDTFLAHKVKRMTRSMAARVVRGGGVTLEPDRPTKPSRVVRAGDMVVLRQTLPPEVLQYDQVTILRERSDFIAFDKPAGMLVHPTARAFRNTLTAYCEHAGLGGLHIVHRLDQETSGVIVMARTAEAAKALSEQFLAGEVRKTYRAVVTDPERRLVEGAEGRAAMPLGFDEESVLPTIKIGRGAWEAETAWRCLRRDGTLAELEVELVRGGRQHQIRAHLALSGHPIVGDKLYLHGDVFYRAWVDGEADAGELQTPTQMLHARCLAFELGGVAHRIEAPVPSAFHALLGPEKP